MRISVTASSFRARASFCEFLEILLESQGKLAYRYARRSLYQYTTPRSPYTPHRPPTTYPRYLLTRVIAIFSPPYLIFAFILSSVASSFIGTACCLAFILIPPGPRPPLLGPSLMLLIEGCW